MSLQQRINGVLEVNTEEIRTVMQTPEMVFKAFIMECDTLVDELAADGSDVADVEAAKSQLTAKRNEAKEQLKTLRAERAKRQVSTGTIQLSGSTSFDAIGLHADFYVQEKLPKGSMASFRVTTLEGKSILAHGPFSDDGSGQFLRRILVMGTSFSFFIPICALRHEAAGRYMLDVQVNRQHGGSAQEIGLYRCEIGLPEPVPWSIETVYGPLLRLLMTMVIADGVMEREEVNLVQKFCQGFLRIDRAQFPDVIEVLKQGASEKLSEDIAQIQYRFPHIPPLIIIQMLAMISRVDGHVHENELKLCRSVAQHFGVGDPQWDRLVKTLLLDRQPESRGEGL